MVTYKYDAWGNHKVYDSTNAENTNASFIGNINPFRYKGYYYDVETKWYYLQSRYYDSLLSRFISMDHTTYLEPGSTVGVNLFAYCTNNPVMKIDPSGNAPKWLKKVLTGLIIVGLVTVVAVAVVASGGTLLIPVLIGATIGAGSSLVGQGVGNILNGNQFFDDISIKSVVMGGLAGAAFATGVGLFGAIAIGATSSAGASAWEDESWANIGVSAFAGGLAAGLGYGAGKLMGKFVFKNSDFGFKDAFDIAIRETNSVFAAALAFRASYYTFLPAVTPGITRGISKFLSNKGLSKS